MYAAIDHAHSGLRYVVLALLLFAILQAIAKRRSGTAYPTKNKLGLYAFMATHIQLLLGLILYFVLSPKVVFEAGVMKDAVLRFYTVEHITGMLLAITLITVGYLKAKRQAGINKGWKTIAVYYGIGLLIIVAMIPWPFRQLGAGWF